jgi:hypothetical protein
LRCAGPARYDAPALHRCPLRRLCRLSAYLGYQNGASLDFVVLRGVFVFIIVCALGFAAEAILSIQVPTTPVTRPPAAPAAAPEEPQAVVAESE